MKSIKKVLSLLMALAMLLTLSISVFAEDENTVTVTNRSGRSYTAYQIFSGTFARTEGTDGGIGTLSNLKWGDGINWDGSKGALAKILAEDTLKKTFEGVIKDNSKDKTSVTDFAEAIQSLTGDTEALYALTEILELCKSDGTAIPAGQESSLLYGYYLFVDQTDGTDGELVNRSLLEVVGSLTLKNKVSKPSLEKKVQDANDSTDETAMNPQNDDNSVWQDSADHDIGDLIPYRLTATLGDTLDGFKTYRLTFKDTMSKGLTLESPITIVINGWTITATKSDETWTTSVEGPNEEASLPGVVNITVKATTISTDGIYKDGTELTIAITDVLPFFESADAAENAKIVVYYQAKLNDQAVIGAKGNPNEAWLEYDNNPNDDQAGSGKTEHDKNIVFTYDLDVDKFNENGEKLNGATFVLYKEINSGLLTNGEESKDQDTSKQYYKDQKVVKINGKSYIQITEKTINNGDRSEFIFEGLDDGNYLLRETKAPDGYNVAPDVLFTIEAKHDEEDDDPELTELKGTNVTVTNINHEEKEIWWDTEKNAKAENYDPTNPKAYDGAAENVVWMGKGNVNITVVDRRGVVFPESGSVGNTSFNVAGGLLIAAAVLLLLVTKRRMSGAADE